MQRGDAAIATNADPRVDVHAALDQRRQCVEIALLDGIKHQFIDSRRLRLLVIRLAVAASNSGTREHCQHDDDAGDDRQEFPRVHERCPARQLCESVDTWWADRQVTKRPNRGSLRIIAGRNPRLPIPPTPRGCIPSRTCAFAGCPRPQTRRLRPAWTIRRCHSGPRGRSASTAHRLPP